MSCETVFADARDYAELICTHTMDVRKEAVVNRQLTITAGAIHAAMAASNQCNCTLASWATNYLAHLNIILAAATQDCPCSTLSNEEKAAYLAFANAELEKIRLRQVDLCGGTGKDYPAFGAIQYNLNVFSGAKLRRDRLDREAT